MKARCGNPNHPDYPYYGGRGITYDPEWETFKGFIKDMGERPEGMTLDRYPDKNGNYCKSNCRWATSREQNCNRQDNNPVPGVRWRKGKRDKSKGKWLSYIWEDGKYKHLYIGPDLFEAICIRKSQELIINGTKS